MKNLILLIIEISVGDFRVFFDVIEKIVIVINIIGLFIEKEVLSLLFILLLLLFLVIWSSNGLYDF